MQICTQAELTWKSIGNLAVLSPPEYEAAQRHRSAAVRKLELLPITFIPSAAPQCWAAGVGQSALEGVMLRSLLHHQERLEQHRDLEALNLFLNGIAQHTYP
jgi:hypothetical protein